MSSLICHVIVCELSCLRQLVDDFTPRSLGFKFRAGHVRLVVDKVAAEQVFSQYFGFASHSQPTQARYLLIHLFHLLCDLSFINNTPKLCANFVYQQLESCRSDCSVL